MGKGGCILAAAIGAGVAFALCAIALIGFFFVLYVASSRAHDDAARKQAFRDLHRSGMAASRAAEARFPDAAMSADPGVREAQEAERHAFYEERKRAGRAEVMRRYCLDDPALEAIDREGIAKRWPIE